MFGKVYIIDDDEVTLYLTALVVSLYAPECCCLEFPDPRLALQTLQQDLRQESMPSLIFLDLNMPWMSGFDFIDALNEMVTGNKEEVRLFVLTSSISEADKKACLERSIVKGYIEKPISPEKLEEIRLQLDQGML